jgi:trehalose 6-phosphate phosphatase
MTQNLPPPSLEWCLFLDVDGTLIELSDTPLDTFADSKLKTILANVAERLGGAVALVSGRSVAYLDALFAPLQLPTAGLHGVERRKASGEMVGASFVDSQLDRARVALAALVQANPGTLLEDKGRTIAVHFRLAPECESTITDTVRSVAAQLGTNYHIQAGNMMLEIKPRGFSKAAAIKAFLQEPPFSGRKPVFVGDDLTDQEGFKTVEDHGGISIAVGERVHGQFRVAGTAIVRRWLEDIAALHDSHHA